LQQAHLEFESRILSAVSEVLPSLVASPLLSSGITRLSAFGEARILLPNSQLQLELDQNPDSAAGLGHNGLSASMFIFSFLFVFLLVLYFMSDT